MHATNRARPTPALLLAFLLAACGGERNTGQYDPDALADAVADTGLDVALDVDEDVIFDTSGDPMVDPALDTGLDSGLDTGTDTAVDTIPEPYPDGTDVTDTDGDTIRDADEGNGAVDTDGDTLPDSSDPDSDGDGIPDGMEAGDANRLTPPLDSDFDGTPDFRDTDADDDTIRDSDEGIADVDGDTIPNYRDLDSDGDYLQDFFEAGDANPATGPFDHDGDLIADYADTDSDNDTISDLDESNVDTGEDGSYDYLTQDSDGDTIPDRDEAGDTSIATPPQNCDDDSLPNYRDTDSDNDGIADNQEHVYGTGICDADSDDDGVTDMVEIAYGSNPLNGSDSPRTHGDFVFEVPYNDTPDPTVDTLVFSTNLQMADVFFTLDSSGSMGGEITNLRTNLRTTVVPGIDAVIPDVWFGVGRFEDCPATSCANSMARIQAITSNITLVENALATMTNTCGGWEPYTQDLYVIASGDVAPFASWPGVHPTSWTCTAPGSIGWPCFRPGAVPIIMQFGDEAFSEGISSCSPSRTHAQAVTAMNAIRAKYVGVNSGSSRSDMVTIANGTGSRDTSGTPLVFDIPSDGSGLGTQVVNAVSILANQVSIRVDAVASDDPSDSINAVVAFIDHINSNTSGMTIWDPILLENRICTVAGAAPPTSTRVVLGSGGTPPTTDHFAQVLPGVPICFDIFPKMNTTVPPTTDAQIFMAIIDVIGDGYTPLDSRDVYFLVPPVIPGGN